MGSFLGKFLKSDAPSYALLRLGALAGTLGGALGGALGVSFAMPGSSFKGPSPEEDEALRTLSAELRKDVEDLCGIGERNSENYENMLRAVEELKAKFADAGLQPDTIDYHAKPALLARLRGASGSCRELLFSNVVAEAKGRELPDEIFVVGAHYDSAPFKGCLGADDNISGVAATLSLARSFAKKPAKRTLRFIAFANEEPPFFWTEDMGSRVCAKLSAQRKEKIVAMLTPECVGFYSDEAGSQGKPPLPPGFGKLIPETGNFLAIVGGTASTGLARDFVEAFRRHARLPSEGAAIPLWMPGAGWSDHWSYAKEGYPALMATDTAFLRNRNYHQAGDRPGTLDFKRMALAVEGLEKAVREIADR